MFKRVRVSLLAVLALGIAGTAFADSGSQQGSDPTPHQIDEAMASGHVAEAQQMIDQVLRDHPRNAKAHYVAAKIDAHIGDIDAGRQQLANAKELDPTGAFAPDRAELSALERRLTGMRAVPEPGPGSLPFAPVVRHSAVPWGLIIIVALGAFVLWSIFRNRAQRAYSQTSGPGVLPPGNPGMQPGYGSGYLPYPPPGGGSGLMGNLASGLAIGAGVAAGEELVRHVIDGNGNVVPAPAADFRDPPQGTGGNDFGTQDGNSWGNDSGSGDSGGDWGGGGGDGGGGGGDWS
jgi:uncharacterized protein